MRVPRVRVTILALMVTVLVAGLILSGFVVLRERRSRAMNLRAAAAGYQQARLTREVAELAAQEYIEGIFRQDLATVDGEIALAESDLARARDRLAWSEQMRSSGPLRGTPSVAEKLAVEKARFEVEQARTRRAVLLNYTKVKNLKELQAEVAKSRADELSRKATLDLLKARGTWPF